MDNFKIHILASGSKGNATIIQAGNTAILVDAGISARRLKAGIERVGLKASELSGIFLTHEHTDHISGLPVFCRKNPVPVFANEATWFKLGIISKIAPASRRMLPDQDMQIGELTVRPFNISHDAASPVGFNFYYKSRKCSFVTDMGRAEEVAKEALFDSDAIIVEANHDAELLRTGRYPYYLKERIKSSRGHLSNVETGELLGKVIAGKKTQVFLAHLSQENNRPELARRTVMDILQAKGLLQRTDIYVASQEQMVSNWIKGE